MLEDYLLQIARMQKVIMPLLSVANIQTKNGFIFLNYKN